MTFLGTFWPSRTLPKPGHRRDHRKPGAVRCIAQGDHGGQRPGRRECQPSGSVQGDTCDHHGSNSREHERYGSRRRGRHASTSAEVEPNQKERIILGAQESGNVVGYLGDGINDAPALHASDVGISVDGAVDVAKEAADIVLLEKDLGVLADGAQEGRTTFRRHPQSTSSWPPAPTSATCSAWRIVFLSYLLPAPWAGVARPTS